MKPFFSHFLNKFNKENSKFTVLILLLLFLETNQLIKYRLISYVVLFNKKRKKEIQLYSYYISIFIELKS